MGRTQTEVAKFIGVSTSAYAHYEQGVREPSLDILAKICLYLKVSANYLLGLE